MRKINSTAKLKNLPPEFQAQIAEWCDEPRTDECSGGLAHAREKLADQGISVGKTTVAEFYKWYQLRQSLEAADADALDAEAWMKDFQPNNEEAARRFGEFIFMQRAVRSQDSKVFRDATAVRDSRVNLEQQAQAEATRLKQRERQLMQKDRDLELSERRVKLLEERDKQARDLIGDSALTPEQKEQRIKAIFGIVG